MLTLIILFVVAVYVAIGIKMTCGEVRNSIESCKKTSIPEKCLHSTKFWICLYSLVFLRNSYLIVKWPSTLRHRHKMKRWMAEITKLIEDFSYGPGEITNIIQPS